VHIDFHSHKQENGILKKKKKRRKKVFAGVPAGVELKDGR
jgi:hypothetical protein